MSKPARESVGSKQPAPSKKGPGKRKSQEASTRLVKAFDCVAAHIVMGPREQAHT